MLNALAEYNLLLKTYRLINFDGSSFDVELWHDVTLFILFDDEVPSF